MLTASNDKPLVYKLPQVALLLSVSVKTVRRRIEQGVLRAFHSGGVWVVKAADLQSYVDHLEPVRRVRR